MRATLFSKLCGNCRKCGTYKHPDRRDQFKQVSDTEWGDALNAKGWCRACVDEWIAKNQEKKV